MRGLARTRKDQSLLSRYTRRGGGRTPANPHAWINKPYQSGGAPGRGRGRAGGAPWSNVMTRSHVDVHRHLRSIDRSTARLEKKKTSPVDIHTLLVERCRHFGISSFTTPPTQQRPRRDTNASDRDNRPSSRLSGRTTHMRETTENCPPFPAGNLEKKNSSPKKMHHQKKKPGPPPPPPRFRALYAHAPGAVVAVLPAGPSPLSAPETPRSAESCGRVCSYPGTARSRSAPPCRML